MHTEDRIKLREIIKSKTVTTGIGAIVGGAVLCFLGDYPEGIALIFLGAQGIFQRIGTAKTERAVLTVDRSNGTATLINKE